MQQKSEQKRQSFEEIWNLINIKKYTQAGLILKTITNHDEDWFLAYGRCLFGLKRFEKALNAFGMLLNGKHHKNALLGIARCYQKRGQFDLAIQIHKSFLNWINDKDILVGIARCYEDMGQFALAVQTYKSVPYWEKDHETLRNIGYCYQKIKKYDLAIGTYQSSYHLQKNKKALLGQARCYQEMGQFGLALKTIKSINIWREDKQTLLILARLYQEIGLYDLAVLSYQSIHNWKTSRDVLFPLAHCYQEMKQFDLAIETYKSIDNWINDKQVQLSLASCCDHFGLQKEAKQVYIEILQRFPNAVDAHILFYQFLTTENKVQANSFLDACISQWPLSVKLQLFKAECEYQEGNKKQALDRLKQYIQKHPYSMKTYFALIKYLLAEEEITEARKLHAECLQLFQGNDRLFKHIEKLVETTNVTQLLNISYSSEILEIRKVVLTPSIQNIFQLINKLPGKHYLVGSSLLALIEGKAPKVEQDVDLVLTQACPRELVEKGLRLNPHLSFLYSGRINDTKVDCVIPSIKRPSDQLFHPDFSIAAILCDANGKLYDFSGYGIQDVKNKVLRTVENPVQCFAEDMIRLLRAMNYMLLGYNPTPEVDAAIRNWLPLKRIDFAHLHAVARKHWLRFSNEKRTHYLDLLADYGLLKKLFHLDQNTPDLHHIFWQKIQPTGSLIPKSSQNESQWKKNDPTKIHFEIGVYSQHFFAEKSNKWNKDRNQPLNERLDMTLPHTYFINKNL